MNVLIENVFENQFLKNCKIVNFEREFGVEHQLGSICIQKIFDRSFQELSNGIR